jgi:hypothetical protein
LKSDVASVGPNQFDVSYEIDVPGPNAEYTFRYDIDPATMQMRGKWVKGDIKGSFCEWKVSPHGQDTLVTYTTASRNFSSVAQALEDDQQTITVGVNVSAALAVVKAVKRRAETPIETAKKP